MTGRIIQQSLFEAQPLISNNPVSENGWIKNFRKNDAVAFGITYSGLLKGKYYILKNIFYGSRNLAIPLGMMSMENASEILSKLFAASGLKRRNEHLNNSDISRDFFGLIKYMNSYSYRDKNFWYLAKNFKRFSDIKERKRLELFLDKNKQNKFVESFFTPYNPSHIEKMNGFCDPNCDGRDKGIYAKMLYNEFKFSSERVE